MQLRRKEGTDMNEHDATEIAYKNGYKKAAEEIFAEIEKHKTIPFGAKCEVIPFYVIAELKKKYTEGET